MSNPVALGAWRRRAGGERVGHRRPPAKAGVGAGAIAVACLLATRLHTSAPTPTTTPGPPPCPAVTTPLRADVDGDGCDEQVSFTGGVLTAGHTAMRVGGPDDQIALGRWTCGPVTVALLRPATGEVFRFDGWAKEGNPVAAVDVGRVDDAVGLRPAAQENGRCDDIAVSRTTGPPVLLPYRAVAG